MKKFLIVPVIALLFAACGSTGANEEAVEAAFATLREDEMQMSCDTMDLYTPAGFERTLIEAYENGKPDGIIWIRVNHSPSNADLSYLVDLYEEACTDEVVVSSNDRPDPVTEDWCTDNMDYSEECQEVVLGSPTPTIDPLGEPEVDD